jgi:hypothetical protein
MLTFNLIQHLTYLLQQLEPYLYPQSTPMMEGMIFEIIRRLDLDSVDIHVAVVYLQRLLICLPGTPSALHCYTKPLVFLATLRVAHKFVCDFSYFRMHLFTTLSRAFYITTQDFNSCEFFLMKALDWDLNVSELQFSLLKASFEETVDPRSRICSLIRSSYDPPTLRRADAKAGDEFSQHLIESASEQETLDRCERRHNWHQGSFYPKGDGFGVANPVSRYIFLLLLFFFDCVIYSMSDWLPLYVDHRNLTYCNKVFSNKLPNST